MQPASLVELRLDLLLGETALFQEPATRPTFSCASIVRVPLDVHPSSRYSYLPSCFPELEELHFEPMPNLHVEPAMRMVLEQLRAVELPSTLKKVVFHHRKKPQTYEIRDGVFILAMRKDKANGSYARSESYWARYHGLSY